jgi:hypothetical protein
MTVVSRLRFLAVLALMVACAVPPQAQMPATEPDLAELWQEPADLFERDLLGGPGGTALAPRADGRYEFIAFKTSGTNPGYDVRDGAGRIWSVKLGPESQAEVASSRILWALGYHQPPIYYLPQFDLVGEVGGTKTRARFRTEVPPWQSESEWSWYDNPFADTQPFRGLIVAQLVLNNWDLKTPNNRIYESTDPATRPRRRFVVRDVGSSLGHSRQFLLFSLLRTPGLQGSKNDIDDFEQQGFIRGVEGDRVLFDYRGMNQPLVDRVTVADVVWISERLARIPDGHWQAAFSAADYPPEVAGRYIRKIKAKIAEGLALRAPVTH